MIVNLGLSVSGNKVSSLAHNYIVPDPNVIITTNPDYSYYHYGEDVTLSCIISYPTNIQHYIDVPTQAMIQWTKGW